MKRIAAPPSSEELAVVNKANQATTFPFLTQKEATNSITSMFHTPASGESSHEFMRVLLHHGIQQIVNKKLLFIYVDQRQGRVNRWGEEAVAEQQVVDRPKRTTNWGIKQACRCHVHLLRKSSTSSWATRQLESRRKTTGCMQTIIDHGWRRRKKKAILSALLMYLSCKLLEFGTVNYALSIRIAWPCFITKYVLEPRYQGGKEYEDACWDQRDH